MNKNLLCISFPKKRLPSFSFLVIASFLAPLYASAQPATIEMYAGVNLQVSAQVSTTGMIRIYNAEGKQVYARQTELMAGLNSIEINGLDRLAEGVYVIEMNFNGQKKTEKLIKGNK